MCVNNNKINILNIESSEEVSDDEKESNEETLQYKKHNGHEEEHLDFRELEFTLKQKVVDGEIRERFDCH